MEKGKDKQIKISRIKSISIEENEDVYDIEVQQNHNFFANGILVHNCAEICLNLLGGFCVIGDIAPFHGNSLDEIESGFRALTRALIRTNTMDSIYKIEVERTNRIGISITGIHEFAWKFFKLGFRDLLDEEKSKEFWLTIARFNRAVYDEAKTYSESINVKIPHTMICGKPSGTISKIFGLTEGIHLPALDYYLRWVQFRNTDPLVDHYQKLGYPTKELKTYQNTIIVGFPTSPLISTLGLNDKMVLAGDATPEEQYKWLMLLEKYWIHGTDSNGDPVKMEYGNQLSYTLKFKPDKVSYDEFTKMLKKYQSQIKCCSVMPQEDLSSYEYLPEERISKEEYDKIVEQIQFHSGDKEQIIGEDVAKEHLECGTGGCPIDFKMNK